MRRARGLLLGAALALPACTAARVDFGGQPSLGTIFPEDNTPTLLEAPYARAYREVRDRWSRQAMVVRDWDTALNARVTLASGEVRAAYVRMVAGMRKLPAAGRADLAARQADDAAAGVELWVPMETSRWEWNDLGSSRSVWTITLSDDAGRALEPTSRAQFESKPPELDQLFAGVGPFTLAWRIRFPARFDDGTPVLRPGLHKLTARFSGPLGATEVTWESR